MKKDLTIVLKHEQITVVMKIYWGDPREKICEAVDHIPLSSLGGLQRMIMGSVSNHVVNNVAWPVTVFFTTEPLPANPSSLPRYPPSKELDAKLRNEEARN
ncbi:hypothetical protein Bca101_056791 [Brassica carinata]